MPFAVKENLNHPRDAFIEPVRKGRDGSGLSADDLFRFFEYFVFGQLRHSVVFSS
jgi:hypothetical protein